MKQPTTKDEYITKLRTALAERRISDIDDILSDYEDYFAQSNAKGYSAKESIRRLPTPVELAASYSEGGADGNGAPKANRQLSSAQRATVFGVTLIGDMFLLPIVGIAALMLACFSIVGMLLILVGPLLFIPDSLLGEFAVTKPPTLQLLPTAMLFIASGIVIVGVCMAIAERMYSGIRASIVVRRWLITGRHDNYVKLIPSVSKRLRGILYKTILIATVIAIFLSILLVAFSVITNGTPNFPSTWQ